MVPCLEATINCLEDELWTIREAAIGSVTALIERFPKESAGFCPVLADKFFIHLSDSTYNVRLKAAKALCIIVRLLPDSVELRERVDKYISSHLMRAKEQQNPEDM